MQRFVSSFCGTLLPCLLLAACSTSRPRSGPPRPRPRIRPHRIPQAALQALKAADQAFATRKYRQALHGYETFLTGHGFVPRSERVLYQACRCSFRLRLFSRFSRWERRLRTWFPASSYLAALRRLHWRIAFRQGRFRKAARLLQQQLDKRRFAAGREARLRFALARCYERLYYRDDAVRQYLLVLRLGKKSKQTAHSLFRLADWCRRRGDRELALHYVNRLLSEYPRYPGRQDAMELKQAIRWRYLTKKDGLGDDSISTICFDGDDVWIGTWLGGVSRFTRSVERQHLFTTSNSKLVSNLVRDIAITPTRVWTATFEGLSFYSKQLDRWRTIYTVAGLAYQRIKSLLLDGRKLWVATIAHGVSVLDLDSGRWTTYTRHQGLPDNNVVTLCRTPGSIWVGTVRGGVARYDKGTERWSVFRHGGKGGFPTNNIKAIAFDGSRLWFGTHGKGVVSCSESGDEWKVYTRQNSGLTSDFVYSLAVSPSGEVWMGTLEGGAVVYDDSRKRWRSFQVKDGLSSNDITTIAFEGRHVWFGTLNGGVAILLRDGEEYGR